jgi:hypothetical protein
VTVVSRQVDGNDMRILSRHSPHRRPASVARAVVDQHQLITTADRLTRGSAEPLVQLGEARFLVEAGNDDRQFHGCVL